MASNNSKYFQSIHRSDIAWKWGRLYPWRYCSLSAVWFRHDIIGSAYLGGQCTCSAQIRHKKQRTHGWQWLCIKRETNIGPHVAPSLFQLGKSSLKSAEAFFESFQFMCTPSPGLLLTGAQCRAQTFHNYKVLVGAQAVGKKGQVNQIARSILRIR